MNTLLLKGQMTHRATLGTDPRGNLTRIKRKKTISGAVIPRMAKANLQRNKRRTVFIVISLTLSIYRSGCCTPAL